MKHTHRYLSRGISLMVAASMLSFTVLAADPIVIDQNTPITEYSGDSGTASYTPADSTLTMNNYVSDSYINVNNVALTINYTGSNTVDRGIHANQNLTLTGGNEDSLNVSNEGIALEAKGNLTIQGGTVTAEASNPTGLRSPTAIASTGNISIKDSNVTAAAKGPSGDAICAMGSIEISNQSSVDATGTVNGINSFGKNVTIREQSTVTASGGFDGLYGSGEVHISEKSSVTANGDTYFGIQSENIHIEDSTVKASSKNNSAIANQEYNPQGSIVIENSDVTTESPKVGIEGKDSVVIKNSTVNHTGPGQPLEVAKGKVEPVVSPDSTIIHKMPEAASAPAEQAPVQEQTALYWVMNGSDGWIASTASMENHVLKVEVKTAEATFCTSQPLLQLLQAQGITEIQFITESLQSSLQVADLLAACEAAETINLVHKGTERTLNIGEAVKTELVKAL